MVVLGLAILALLGYWIYLRVERAQLNHEIKRREAEQAAADERLAYDARIREALGMEEVRKAEAAKDSAKRIAARADESRAWGILKTIDTQWGRK